MTDGTMIRPRPRIRPADDEELGGDRRPGTVAAGMAGTARVLGASVALTVAVAGVYALLAPGQTVRGADPRVAAAQAAAPAGSVAKAPAAKGGTSAAQQAPVLGARPGAVSKPRTSPVPLPPAKNLSPTARRTALVSYLTQGGVPVATGPTRIARAAQNTCKALAGGTDAGDFVADLARVSGYTAAQSTTFFVGATHFYCPRYAGALGR